MSLFSKPEQLLFSDLGEEAFIPSPEEMGSSLPLTLEGKREE